MGGSLPANPESDRDASYEESVRVFEEIDEGNHHFERVAGLACTIY